MAVDADGKITSTALATKIGIASVSTADYYLFDMTAAIAAPVILDEVLHLAVVEDSNRCQQYAKEYSDGYTYDISTIHCCHPSLSVVIEGSSRLRLGEPESVLRLEQLVFKYVGHEDVELFGVRELRHEVVAIRI